MGNKCVPVMCGKKSAKYPIAQEKFKYSLNAGAEIQVFEKSYRRPANPALLNLYFVRWLVEKWLFHILKDEFPLEHAQLRALWHDKVKGVENLDPQEFRDNYLKQAGFREFTAELEKLTAAMARQKPRKTEKLETLSLAIRGKAKITELEQPGSTAFVCIEQGAWLNINSQQHPDVSGHSIISLK